jgi:hypothetical protein
VRVVLYDEKVFVGCPVMTSEYWAIECQCFVNWPVFHLIYLETLSQVARQKEFKGYETKLLVYKQTS